MRPPPPRDDRGDSNPGVRCLVDRAKRVAGQMWVCLHAQSCCKPGCTVQGCVPTRALLRLGQQCRRTRKQLTPNQHAALCKAKKLIQHFSECRAARHDSTPNSPHYCLVCSLVARARMAPDETLRRFRLDYSVSPYSVEVPTSVARRLNPVPEEEVSSAPTTPGTARRRRSASWDGTPSKPSTRRGNKRPARTTDFFDAAEAERSLHLGASMLSALRPPPPVEPEVGLAELAPEQPVALKRHRSASWGGEWHAERNTAPDLLATTPEPLAASSEALDTKFTSFVSDKTDRPPSPAGTVLDPLPTATELVAPAPPRRVVSQDAALSLMQLADAVNIESPSRLLRAAC